MLQHKMAFFLIFLLLQGTARLEILSVEDARSQDVSALLKHLESDDRDLQRLAVRALGRLERKNFQPQISRLLKSPHPGVRLEAINALGQIQADQDWGQLLEGETVPAVRAMIYATAGRSPGGSEELLRLGLSAKTDIERESAAKGAYQWYRANEKHPAAATLESLRKLILENNSSRTKQLALLTLNLGKEIDERTARAASGDSDPLVRRLVVASNPTLADDPSYLVRYEDLKQKPSCSRTTRALQDPSEHIVLLAIDLMGDGCDSQELIKLVDTSEGWRRQAHALVSLAKTNPPEARTRLPRFLKHPLWQVRAYAAGAAKILNDSPSLEQQAGDAHPNVVTASLRTPEDALRALEGGRDYGLIMRATELLKNAPQVRNNISLLLQVLEELGSQKRATSRDPRKQILELIRQSGDRRSAGFLMPLLADFDPVIAGLAADIMREKTGESFQPKTTQFARPLPIDTAYLNDLEGAQAEVKMQEAGSFIIQLLPQEAPFTAVNFARLAEKGYYDGLTFHRIVPNFVLQGGSPGANEYEGAAHYIRDEVGTLSHLRGTLGISTRGRDTGDSQIFINLVDNFRLDHNYTVFARVVSGMDQVDQILEGDTIESIQILRP